MDDNQHLTNKIFGKSVSSDRNKDLGLPIKKCHFLEGKYFIVIDQSIAEQLKFSESKYKEQYFQQEVTEGDSIILRPFKMRE